MGTGDSDGDRKLGWGTGGSDGKPETGTRNRRLGRGIGGSEGKRRGAALLAQRGAFRNKARTGMGLAATGDASWRRRGIIRVYYIICVHHTNLSNE